MHKLLSLVFLIFLASFTTVHAATISPGQKVYNQVSDSVYTIFSIDEEDDEKSALGSAVAIEEHLLATNCHVALSGSYLIIEINSEPYYGRLYYYNQAKDLCLVEIVGTKLKPVNIRASKTVQIGEEVYAIGNPEGIDRTISRGIISNREMKNGKLTRLQTDAAISQGSSGGGLFDQDGNLIGITTSIRIGAENIAFAIPTELISNFLTPEEKEKNEPEKQATATSTSAENKVTPIQTYGNDKIELVKWEDKCMIAIKGQKKNSKPLSIVLWSPTKPDGLIVFSRVSEVQKAINFITYLRTQKNVEYYTAKSRLSFDRKLHELTLISIDDKDQPVYVFTLKENLGEKFSQMKYFIGQYYGYDDTPTLTPITYGLDGFAEALKGYDEHCKGKDDAKE